MLREIASAGRRHAVAAVAAAAGIFVIMPVAASHAVASRTEPVRVSEVTVAPPLDTHLPQGTGLYAVSCARPGACAAGGNYENATGSVQPMVATQTHGKWLRAAALLLPANAAAQPYAQVNGIACSKPGSCVAAGNYTYNPAHDVGAFLATQSNGRWGRAFMPRLPANAAKPPQARLEAVACRPNGFCEAVGSYLDTTGRIQSMALAKPPGGTWGGATEIAAPLGASAAGPDAVMTGLACTGPGSCVAVGHYSMAPGRSRGMGAVQTGGRWHQAVPVFAPPGAVPSSYTALTAVSCTARGTCLAVGTYPVTSVRYRAMSVTESHGAFGWTTAITAVPPGAAASPSTALSGVSCPPAGPCVAAGVATSKTGHYVAMSATRWLGRWNAAFLTGPANVRTGKNQQSSLFSVSCAAGERCEAVGYYNDASGGYSAGAAAIH